MRRATLAGRNCTSLPRKHPVLTAVRGRGLMLAFDLPTSRDCATAFGTAPTNWACWCCAAANVPFASGPSSTSRMTIIDEARVAKIIDAECRRTGAVT